MASNTTIVRLTGLLGEANLPWLLPVLRQDVLVWKSLCAPEFFNKVTQLHSAEGDIIPATFSPARLALIALDHPISAVDVSTALIDLVDSQLIQLAMRSFNDGSSLLSDQHNLTDAGLISLALAHKYQATRSWTGLLDLLEDRPGSHWMTPLVCLYGMVSENAGLLDALVQPGKSPFRFELAVHIILSTPTPPQEQLNIIMDLCHGPYGDLLPARERLLLVNSLSEHSPSLAKDFCLKWLESPRERSTSGEAGHDVVENIDLLMENLFQIEVSKLAGQAQDLLGLLASENELTQHVTLSLINQYASQLANRHSDTLSVSMASALHDRLVQSATSGSMVGKVSSNRAQSALILAEQGYLEEATQLLKDADSALPDDPFRLYAIARIAVQLGDHQRARNSATRLCELVCKQPSNYSIPVWQDQLSLVNIGKLLLELHQLAEASCIFSLALQTCPNDARLLELLAESYKSARKEQEVVDTLQVLVSLFPDELQYRRENAHALETLGDWNAALGERKRIIEASQAKSVAASKDDLYACANCSLNASRPDLTLAICNDLFARDQEDSQALIYTGKAYLLMGEAGQGMDILLRATQVSPDRSEAWLALAEAQKKIYPLKTVIDTLTNASQSTPDSAQIHFALGELYLQDNAPTLALPELQSAVSLSPDEPRMLVTYGQALNLLGLSEEGYKVYSKAYGIEPNYPGLAQDFARLLMNMGRLEEALAPLEVLIDSQSAQDLSAYMEYARCVLSLNKTRAGKIPPLKALIALNEVLQIDPECAEAKALIAESLAANGDNEMAFQAYREALDTPLIEDRNWLERLAFGFGSVASSIGKHDVAIAALQEASQINPENLEAHKVLSDAFLAANLPDEAIRAARDVLVIDGDDPDNLVWFAKQAVNLIRAEKSNPFNATTTESKTVPSEAVNALTKAIQLIPTRSDLLVQLGNLQAEIGSLTEAHDTYASIAQMDCATIDDLTNAAGYLSSVGDHASAIACLENAVTQDQKEADHHDSGLYAKLAEELVKNNDHASAIHTLDEAITLIPGEASLVTQKIDILLGMNQAAEALDCIQSTVEAYADGSPKTDLLFLASRINRCAEDFPAALKYAQQALDALSKSSTIEDMPEVPIPHRSLIAEIYRSLAQPEQAYCVIQGEKIVSTSDFPDRQAYLDFICLHTELALETGNPVRSDFQDLPVEITNPSYPRLMAVKARLMNKAGNTPQAEQIFQLALNSITTLDQPGTLPAWTAEYNKYLTLNSIVEASLDLGLWDQARNGAECVIDSAPFAPWSYLNLAKAIVLQAEFYNLCEIFSVSKHRPAADSVSVEAYSLFVHSIDQLKTVLEPCKAGFAPRDYELTDDQIFRWQARADIAFKPGDSSRPEPGEVLLHQLTASDAAAMIAYLHQLGMADPDSDSVNRIIKIGRSFPKSSAVLLQVALAISENNPEEAMKSLQTGLEQNPYSKSPVVAFCNILLVKIAISLNDLNLAQVAAENALEIWPDEPGWHSLAAQISQRAADNNGAISHLLEATRLAPKNITYHQELGKVYFENASDDAHLLRQAAKSFENVLSLDPADVTALIFSARIQYLLNDPASAETYARKALLHAADQADIYLLLSEIAIRNSDYQGAYEYANKAIDLSPKDVQAGIALARSLAALGRHNEALLKLASLLPAGAEEKLIHLERVNILRKVNGPKAGVSELQTLANTFPEDFSILNALAKSYVDVGELENAVDIAQLALNARTQKTSRNEQANLHLLIGQVLRQAGQLDGSIDHLSEAIQLAPDRLEPYLELGLARKERREYQQALQIFEQATSIAPEDPRAPFQAGLALKESKDYKSSETMLRKAVSLAPNDLNIRRQLAAVVALNLVHNPRTGRS